MGPPQPGGQLQAAVTTASNILWSIYRTYFSGVVAQLVPAHTRDAAFQLFCDLRANTPKDQKFVARHVRAFVPHSSTGWLALASGLSYALAAAAGLGCMLLALSVAGIYTSVALAVVGGLTLSFVLSVLAIGMAVTACCSGAFAFGALLSYASLSSALAVARFLLYLVSPAAPAASRADSQALTPSPDPQQAQQPQQGQQGQRLISPPPTRLKELAATVPAVMAAAAAKPQEQGQPLPTDSAGSAAGGAAGAAPSVGAAAEEPSTPSPELAPAMLTHAPAAAAMAAPAAAEEAAPAVAVENGGEGLPLVDGPAAAATAAAREQASVEQDALEWAAAVAAGQGAGASVEAAAPADTGASVGVGLSPVRVPTTQAAAAAPGTASGAWAAEEPFVLKSRAGKGGGLRVSVNGINTPPTEPEEMERDGGEGGDEGGSGGKQDSAAELSYSRTSSGKEPPRDGTPRADEAAAAAAKQRWMWEGSPGRWSPEKMQHHNFPGTPSSLRPQDSSNQPAREA